MQAVTTPVVEIKSVMLASSYHTMLSEIPSDFLWIRKKREFLVAVETPQQHLANADLLLSLALPVNLFSAQCSFFYSEYFCTFEVQLQLEVLNQLYCHAMQTISLIYLFWCRQQQHVVRDKFQALSLQFHSGTLGMLPLLKLD